MAIEFWKDREKKILRVDLFAEQAEAWAKTVFEDRGRDNNKSSQIRRFYDEVVRFESLIAQCQGPEDFERQLPYLRMLNAKVNYAKARERVSLKFVEFIKQGIAQVSTPDDFAAFKSFFEAFMGYYKVYSPK